MKKSLLLTGITILMVLVLAACSPAGGGGVPTGAPGMGGTSTPGVGPGPATTPAPGTGTPPAPGSGTSP